MICSRRLDGRSAIETGRIHGDKAIGGLPNGSHRRADGTTALPPATDIHARPKAELGLVPQISIIRTKDNALSVTSRQAPPHVYK
jgi:hypothetical protein